MNLYDWAKVALDRCSDNDQPVSLHWLEHVKRDSDEDLTIDEMLERGLE